jgi:hypothetical protein
MDRGASCIPLYLKMDQQGTLHSQGDGGGSVLNLSARAAKFLEDVKGTPEQLFYHAVAVLHAPAYRAENATALRQDWPRLPLPNAMDELAASAKLGGQLASLLDTEAPSAAADESRLRQIAGFKLGGTGPLDEGFQFAITAGWGHAGKGGITMPGSGRTVERDYTPQERESLGEAVKLLGDRTLDVYLNESACWANIPARVWEYTIGGYQVIKKWLSYREQKLLGRPLTKDEVRYVQEMARRIARILSLEPSLDSNYEGVKLHPFSW